jgi:hypothetical protein
VIGEIGADTLPGYVVRVALKRWRGTTPRF